MPQTRPRPERKIHGSVLGDWLLRAGEGTQEIIVEAAVPARKVTSRRGVGGRYQPSALAKDKGSGLGRAEVLDRLGSYLTCLLPEPPTALHGAGAFAVRANSDQLRHIAQHPLVRAIRPNRRRRL